MARESVSANSFLVPYTFSAILIVVSKRHLPPPVIAEPHSYLYIGLLESFYIPYIELIISLSANYLTSKFNHKSGFVSFVPFYCDFTTIRSSSICR